MRAWHSALGWSRSRPAHTRISYSPKATSICSDEHSITPNLTTLVSCCSQLLSKKIARLTGILQSSKMAEIDITAAKWRLVEVGRVVLFQQGEFKGRLAAIVEIIDHKRVR
jgi:hypothetical protein